MDVEFKAIRTKVAGVTHENRDGSSRQYFLSMLSYNDELKLRDMSSPEYPEAVGVFDLSGRQIGFLPKEIAQQLRDEGMTPDDFNDCTARITHLGKDYGYMLGCDIIFAYAPGMYAARMKNLADKALAERRKQKRQERKVDTFFFVARWVIISLLVLALVIFICAKYIEGITPGV